MSRLTILSLDPGKVNFAFCIVQFDTKTGMKYKILTTGMIANTVTSMIGEDPDIQSSRFLREIRALVRTYKVNALVAERYMIRGVQRGGGAELIGGMIFLLMSLRMPKRFITAAQWKNSFNKLEDLNWFYKQVPLVPHRVDAALIGIYSSSFFLGTKHFECIATDVDKCRLRITKTGK